MEVDSLEYYEWIRDQRLEDIANEEAIGVPDRQLMQILIAQLEEALKKINELNG